MCSVGSTTPPSSQRVPALWAAGESESAALPPFRRHRPLTDGAVHIGRAAGCRRGVYFPCAAPWALAEPDPGSCRGPAGVRQGGRARTHNRMATRTGLLWWLPLLSACRN